MNARWVVESGAVSEALMDMAQREMDIVWVEADVRWTLGRIDMMVTVMMVFVGSAKKMVMVRLCFTVLTRLHVTLVVIGFPWASAHARTGPTQTFHSTIHGGG